MRTLKTTKFGKMNVLDKKVIEDEMFHQISERVDAITTKSGKMFQVRQYSDNGYYALEIPTACIR